MSEFGFIPDRMFVNRLWELALVFPRPLSRPVL